MGRSGLHFAAEMLAIISILFDVVIFCIHIGALIVLGYFPVMLYVVAIVLLIVAVNCAKKAFLMISIYWFVVATVPIGVLLYFTAGMPDDLFTYCILSAVCFALIGLFVLLWNRLRKMCFLIIAGVAVLVSLIYQVVLLCQEGFVDWLQLGAYLPWRITVPLIPAAVTCLMIIDKHRAKTLQSV